MNPYRSETSKHRPFFALAAVVMTTICIALAVVAPAVYEPAREVAPATAAEHRPADLG